MNTKVLITPLNWGLGHATRCIPVIDAFRRQGAEVVLASDGQALAFLRDAFPDLPAHDLPGYHIRYPRNGSMAAHMCLSAPHIFRTIRAERDVVREIVNKEKVNLIVSDNRYGCHMREVNSILMTHQVHIRVPPLLRWAAPLVNRMNRRLLSRFDTVWIPDLPGEPNLAGALSHPMPVNGIYVGPLSRFGRTYAESTGSYDVLVLCSGPEPQRTVLEHLLRRELQNTELKAVIIRGVVTPDKEPVLAGKLTTYDWLPSWQLELLMREADMVITRSGYSTIMDLARMGKKAMFIPTPGQTEQEYLARYFSEKNLFYSESQASFSLSRGLERSQAFTGIKVPFDDTLLNDAIRSTVTLNAV